MTRRTLLLLCLTVAACGTEATDNNEAISIQTDSGRDATAQSDMGSTPDVAADVDMGPFGGDRPADVVLPMDWTSEGSYPVVVLLHGYGASSTLQNAYLRTSALVDEFQFVLVLPEGLKNSENDGYWNATDICCDLEGDGVDDSTYLSELGLDAIRRYAGDPGRLYFMGHSNGGYMSFRLACDHSDKIAAIASLAGSSWVDPARCGTPDPVSVLHIHGTQDPTVLYAGRPTKQPGAQEVVDRWVDRNGCGDGPAFGGAADFDSSAAGDETRKEKWSGCNAGTSVELWTMDGSGHIPRTGEEFARDILGFLLSHSK